MAIHIIPQTETDLHIEDQDCPCNPELKLDEQSGEMVWVHELLKPERLLEDFIKL